jgi:hypothetical protein
MERKKQRKLNNIKNNDTQHKGLHTHSHERARTHIHTQMSLGIP